MSEGSRGRQAAYGDRQRMRSALRRRALRFLRRVEHRLRAEPGDYLHFVPPVRDARELADLSARVNWYLPEQARRMPVYVERPAAAEGFGPQDAPSMDPGLVRPAGWAAEPPPGRAEVVLHRVTAAGALRYARGMRRATLVAPDFAYGAEEGFFPLHRRCCTTAVPSPEESVRRLLERRVEGADVLVLATGPSAKLVDPATVTQQLRVTCNSAVRDRDLLRRLRPDVIAFGDPVFHHGPSRYAAAFREDLRRALELCDALLLTTHYFAEPLVAAMPDVAERLAVLPLDGEGPWRWPTSERPSARVTGNVLTNLMLPAAFAIGDAVALAGCDGRNPDERYFWKHNARTQYSDELMQACFDAHPAFFRDRDYADYYDEHCRQLEEFLSTAERAGKSASGLTPSYIPALVRRGAPPFAAAAAAITSA